LGAFGSRMFVEGREPMPPNLVVPPTLETLIQEFDSAKNPFTEMDVQQALGAARSALQNPSDEESFGAWAEVLAFALIGSSTQPSPWRTFFGPMGSGTDKDGNTTYFPDIAGADANVVSHWISRAKTVKHPVLKARYADLAWDLCTPIVSGMRRDPEMARLAIDGYLASVLISILPELDRRIAAGLRALDLAIVIRDEERKTLARSALLQMHQEAIIEPHGPWWVTFDCLMNVRHAGVTDDERQRLATDVEVLVLRFGDITKPETFNPHAVQSAARRLINYYVRLQRPDDVKRLHEATARAFEHFAGLGDPMIASTVLQTAINAYSDAGMSDESRRVRTVMEEKISQAGESRVAIGGEFKISNDDVESFIGALVTEDLASTFANIANAFLANRRDLEEVVQKTAQAAPLMARIPITIMADEHVAARIGSVQDDPFGRLLQQTNLSFGIQGLWLREALIRAIEAHSALPEHFVGWGNRLQLFDDATFLMEGVRAWYDRDFVKATHVLVPQIERGLRSIVAKLGKPITKPHSTLANVGVAINMGDILNSPELAAALGPDFTLHFLALYADPRGMNLRNRVAHGLINLETITEHLVLLLIHSLLAFGVWRELCDKRR
jgi:Domain of unknown function (DUF4209)